MSSVPAMRQAGVSVLREVVLLLLFLTLALVFTWPLARNLGRAVSDPFDPYLTTWILDWDLHALMHGPLGIYDAPMFHPARQALAFSENMIGIAILLLPFKLAGAGAITISNIALLAGFAFCGYAACVLARTAGASTLASIVGGIFYAFVPFRFDQIAHIQFIWGGWLALVLATLLGLWRSPTAGRAALFAAALVMNGLTNIHHLAFAVVACSITAVLLAATCKEFFDRRYWGHFFAAFVAAHIVLVPFLLPYKNVSERYKMKRYREEVRMGSATWSDWIAASDRSAVYGDTRATKQTTGEHRLFPGLAATVLALAALLATRRRESEPSVPTPRRMMWARSIDVLILLAGLMTYFALANDRFVLKAGGIRLFRAEWSTSIVVTLLLIVIRFALAVPELAGGGTLHQRILGSRCSPGMLAAASWVLVGFVGSFGMNSFLHSFLYSKVALFQSIRMPVRWAVVTYVGLAALAALGADSMLRTRMRGGRVLLGFALVALMLYDVHPAARTWFMASEVGGDVHRWLRDAPIRGAVVELPIASFGEEETLTMLAATIHHRPLVNGVSGFEPPEHSELCALQSKTPISPEFLSRLRAIGCSLVVVHADRLGAHDAAIRQWLARELAAGRLQFVRRFDHEVHGDYVFAVAGSGEDLRRLRGVERHDPSGRTPEENAAVFIESNGPTFNASPFGYVEWPREGTTVSGALEVRGWALSPAGIDRVDALIENGALRIPCRLVDREDINAVFPWYGRPAGFMLELPGRPRGIHLLTDVQIELHDRAGRTLRLRDVPMVWTER